MANREEVEKARQGAEVWNDYIHTKPKTFKANLFRTDLRAADLRRADLRGAYLHEANLGEANLHEANLFGAYLHEADLRGADLRGAYLTGADLRAADLRGADLTGANIVGANLTGANIAGADLTGADYSSSTIWPSMGFGEAPESSKQDTDTNETEHSAEPDHKPVPTGAEPTPKASVSDTAEIGGWGEVVRIDRFDSEERRRIAGRSLEVVMGYIRSVLDDQAIDGLELGILQSEYDVLVGLSKNPRGPDPQRVEQAIAEAIRVISPLIVQGSDSDRFLDAIQRLGHPNPVDDGEMLIEAIEAAEEIAANEDTEIPEPTSDLNTEVIEVSGSTGETTETQRSFPRRVLDGANDNAEEFGKQILLGLPATVKKSAVAAASLATFAGYGPAAPALKAILNFVISILG